MNTKTLRLPFSLLICFLLSGVSLLPAKETETIKLPPIEGKLVWPKSWTVFAPMQRKDAHLPVEVLKTIPDQLKKGVGPAISH